MKNIRRVAIGFCVSVLFLAIGSLTVLGADYKSITKQSQQYLDWVNLDDETKEQTSMPTPFIIEYKEQTLAESRSLFNVKLLRAANMYNLKNNITIPVKHQGTTNECWAFSANSVIETNLALKNSEVLDFSERYLHYATAKNFTDGTNPKGWNRDITQGGNMFIALPFYVSGQGPILENEMPFVNNETKIELASIQNKTTVKKIESYVIFPGIVKTRTGNTVYYTNGAEKDPKVYTEVEVNSVRNAIKEHIIKYGGVSTITYGSDPQNYTTDLTAYYYNGTADYDHQVTIVGWDDNYAVTNFKEGNRPVNPGAYIALNSYGTTFGDSGYYYISYDDTYVEASMFGVKDITNIDYDHIYQYDEYGVTDTIAITESTKTVYGANVFTRDSSKNENLQEVGIYSLGYVNCEVYVNPTNGTLNSENLTKVTSSVVSLVPGYQTIKLSSPVQLTGTKFAIVVKYTSDTLAFASLENRVVGGPLFDCVTSGSGQSYISTDLSDWTDVTTLTGYQNANICIKAFTKEAAITVGDITIKDTYAIDINNYIYKIPRRTSVATFISKIESNYGMNIYDKSSQLVSEGTYVGTGMVLKVNGKNYSIVVTGDLSGDGEISIIDLNKLKSHIVGRTGYELTGGYFKAANLSYDRDDEVTILDLNKMKRIVTGMDD